PHTYPESGFNQAMPLINYVMISEHRITDLVNSEAHAIAEGMEEEGDGFRIRMFREIAAYFVKHPDELF
ncbi:MAG: hypothetical protein KY468_11620, partial [Armatimonadetes bacterium]|nr:hypothetical protein [Armatimonadota bacterium]